MKNLLASWERACAASRVLRFVDLNLRGIGQVMFQDNPLSGLLFLVAICWGSWAAGVPQVAIGGLVALVAGTLTAQWLRVDAAALGAGLYGFNAYLVGLALPTFFAATPLLWVYVILGGAVSTVAMLAISNVFRTWDAPALTAPFVLVAWLLLLSAGAFSWFDGGGLPRSALIVAIDPALASPLHPVDLLQGTFRSISQVFLKGNGISALLLLAGLAVSSVAAAVFGFVGALVAVLVAHLFGAESDLVTGGLLGFSPVLTAIALGAVFNKPGPGVVTYALLGTVFTVIVQGAMNAGLTPFGIPSLTAPFVLVTWLFLLARPRFDGRP